MLRERPPKPYKLLQFFIRLWQLEIPSFTYPRGGGDSHAEQTGMLVGNLNLTPKGDQSGRGLSKFWPLKETT